MRREFDDNRFRDKLRKSGFGDDDLNKIFQAANEARPLVSEPPPGPRVIEVHVGPVAELFMILGWLLGTRPGALTRPLTPCM